MGTDFSFDDRVAQRYNLQRAHPPEVSGKVGAAVAALTGEGALVLEIGVGTGRIAWPVARAGCQVVGFDLSGEMLSEVYGGADADSARPLVLQADMHALPFPAGRFAAVMAVHVLHLAQDWQKVLREAARVLQSGGAFIRGEDWISPDSLIGSMRRELRQYVMENAPNMRPPAAGISKDDLLMQLGGTDVSEVTAAEWTIQVSPAEWLEIVENRMDTESWVLPEPFHKAVREHLRMFAQQTWPNLDEKQPVTRRFNLKVNRGDW